MTPEQYKAWVGGVVEVVKTYVAKTLGITRKD